MKKIYFLSAFILLFLTVESCSSVKRNLENISKGKYDDAISLAVKKLAKNKTSKDNDPHIGILEDAFRKANDENLRLINSYKKPGGGLANYSSNDAANIYYAYTKIINRQNTVRPLLPLYSTGLRRDAVFDMTDYSREMQTARENYAEALYQDAERYMVRNTKNDYRSAYEIFSELNQISPNYKNSHQQMDDAQFYGTDFVLVTIKNHTNQIIPTMLENDLLDFNTYKLDKPWTAYHSEVQQGVDYTYGVDLNFESILIAPERIHESSYDRKKKVVDGYENAVDRWGNIVKDSLGNPVKVEKYKDVTARIRITTQEKAVNVSGMVNYLDYKRNRVTNRYPLVAEYIFQNVFADYSGDMAALTDEDLRLVKNRFMPFPSNEQMVFDAGNDIKAQLSDILKRYPIKR